MAVKRLIPAILAELHAILDAAPRGQRAQRTSAPPSLALHIVRHSQGPLLTGSAQSMQG